MDQLTSLMDDLYKIEVQLNTLNSKYADLYQAYSGDTFTDQNLYADKLEDLIHTATHETGSQIGFIREHMGILAKYIDFRKENNDLSETEFETIIDHETVTLSVKMALSKRLKNKNDKSVLNRIEIIRSVWDNLFKNRSFNDIRAILNK